MYIFATSVYPNEKAKEVADMYFKAVTKYPDNNSVSTPIVPVAVHATLEGIKVINVYEVKKGKYEDAHAIAANRLAMLQNIPGFKWKIETYLTLEGALKVIGM